jgi:hypothetical protein
MVSKPDDNTLVKLAGVRVEGKPFVVSEYNHPFPNRYDAETLPLAAAFAARQDWDALILFDYNASSTWGREKIGGFFEAEGHPVKTAQMPSASAIFVRGDIPPAAEVRIYSIDSAEAVRKAAGKSWWDVSGMLKDLQVPVPSVNIRQSIRTTGNRVQGIGNSNDSGFSWTLNDGKGILQADFPNVKAAAGFIGGHQLSLGSLKFTPETEFTAVTVIPLDGKPLERSSRILLTACGRSENSGMAWDETRTSLTSWGSAPALTEAVKGRLEVKGDFIVWALDPAGRLSKRLNVSHSNGFTYFDIGGDISSLWYLVMANT